MKVSAKDPNLNLLAYVQSARNRKNGAEGVRPLKDAARQDTVMISTRGRDIREAIQIAKSRSDIREEMVEAIRTRIQNGTYEIDCDRIAVSMISESLLNDMMSNNSEIGG